MLPPLITRFMADLLSMNSVQLSPQNPQVLQTDPVYIRSLVFPFLHCHFSVVSLSDTELSLLSKFL